MSAKRRTPDQRHEGLLDHLKALRTDLYHYTGIDGPLSLTQAVQWVFEREQAQPSSGERLTLAVLATRSMPREVASAWGRATGQITLSMGSLKRHGTTPVSAHVFYRRDVFAGAYLKSDTNRWPIGSLWNAVIDAGVVAPLALVAAAATEVVRVTGGRPEQATAFLLCGERFPAPEMRAAFSVPGGLHLWAPDPDMTAAQLAAEYAQARGEAGLSPRSRGLSGHTSDLVALVDEMRPPATWRAVWDRWNSERPECPYADPDSLRRSYQATLQARRARGLIDDTDEGR